MGYNKIVYGGKVLIDLTGDNIEASKVLVGFSGHGPDGEPFDGTCTFDVDSSGANLKPSEAMKGKTFAVGGKIVTGTAENNGAVAGIISTKDGVYVVPIGIHDGSGTVKIDPTEAAKLIPSNIRQGITILGVEGSMSGSESVRAQAKSASASTTEDVVVVPDDGFNYLSQVTISKISYVESDNAAGGITVTIG